MKKKKTIRDIDVRGKRILMRVDFNVPLNDASEITDDTRIRAALPTIEALVSANASLVLMSHLGRPKGKRDPKLSLAPVAARLGTLIDSPVLMAPDTVGTQVEEMATALQPGQILLLENTRFHAEEEGKEVAPAAQEAFTRQLAVLGDIYVNDAFGSAHRAHASTALICQFMDVCVAGLLMERELDYLGDVVEDARHPFVAIIGGAKVSGKLEVLHSLMRKVDTILIGGGMAYTFLKARGHTIGNSLVEEDLLNTAKATMEAAARAGVRFLLPIDNIAADAFDAEAAIQSVGKDIPDGWMALDVGPKTAALYVAEVLKAKTIIWNGPMGCFEMEPFAASTMAICQAIAASDAISIIGGGDSVSAVNQSGLAAKMSHISTGGGASLEFLEGKILPGVDALNDKI